MDDGSVAFLFLEIADRDFNAFYEDAFSIIHGAPPRKPPHLTLRGPYTGRISRKLMASCEDALRYAVLEISGVGGFSNQGEEVVYLGVNSPQLREVWWKPDYPIGDYGYNPHISVYRGPDRDLAARLLAFQPLRDVRFLCAEFDIVRKVKRKNPQHDLELEGFARAADHRRFIESEAIPENFFSELRRVVAGSHPSYP